MLSADVFRYILEARKRALAKKKKLRTLGRRARSQGSDDEEEEVDGMSFLTDCSASIGILLKLVMRAGFSYIT